MKSALPPILHACALALALSALFAPTGATAATDTTPAQQLAHWSKQAGSVGDATRGQQFFNQRRGRDWSCASCHGNPPVAQGKHASTGKPIMPLAPAVNPQAFTTSAKVDKWFRRNCNDVLGRECSAAEKADFLAYLIGLKS